MLFKDEIPTKIPHDESISGFLLELDAGSGWEVIFYKRRSNFHELRENFMEGDWLEDLHEPVAQYLVFGLNILHNPEKHVEFTRGVHTIYSTEVADDLSAFNLDYDEKSGILTIGWYK